MKREIVSVFMINEQLLSVALNGSSTFSITFLFFVLYIVEHESMTERK